jgi:hypothetical protein
MSQILEYFGKLSTVQGLLILSVLSIIFASVPYYKLVFAFVRMLIKPVKPEILSFELRYAPDHFIGSEKSLNKEYYLLAAEHGFILDGSKMLLIWKVSGAYKVNLLPFGKNLEGNAAYIVASTKNRIFKLIAYSPVRKVEKIIEIPIEKFISLNNKKLSSINNFSKRIIPEYTSMKFLKASPGTLVYNNFLSSKRLNYYKSIRFESNISKPYEFNAPNESLCRNLRLNNYIEKYEILHLRDYSLNKYSSVNAEARLAFIKDLKNKYPRNNNLHLI